MHKLNFRSTSSKTTHLPSVCIKLSRSKNCIFTPDKTKVPPRGRRFFLPQPKLKLQSAVSSIPEVQVEPKGKKKSPRIARNG